MKSLSNVVFCFLFFIALCFSANVTAVTDEHVVELEQAKLVIEKQTERFEQIKSQINYSDLSPSLSALDKLEKENSLMIGRLEVSLARLNDALSSSDIDEYFKLAGNSNEKLSANLIGLKNEKDAINYELLKSRSLEHLLRMEQKRIIRLIAQNHRKSSLKRTEPIYSQELWTQAIKEFKANFFTIQALKKLFYMLAVIFCSVVTFALLQHICKFVLAKFDKFFCVRRNGLLNFSLNYFFRYVLFAIMLYISYGVICSTGKYDLAAALFRALGFMSLALGLFRGLVICFLPEDAVLSKKKQLGFYGIVGFFALQILINDVHIWNLTGYYQYHGSNLSMNTVLNFFFGVIYCFLVLVFLPKEFKSELFSKVLHKEYTYFFLRTVTVLGAVAYPVLIFFGYTNLPPNILTNLFQISVLTTILSYLHKVFNHVFPVVRLMLRRMIFKRKENDNEMPKLLSYWSSTIFAAVLIVVGFIIWLLIVGVPPSGLYMIYQQLFINGLPIGRNMHFSIGHLFWSVITFLIIFYAARVLQYLLDRRVLSYTNLDFGTRQAIKTTVGYLGLALAAVMAIISVGFDMKTITFMLSGLSVGIGIGMKDMFMNFFSGFVLLIERPIKEGDYLVIDGKFGRVNKIRLRSTEVILTDKSVVIVPNSEFVVSKITNGSVGALGLITLEVTVPYEAESSVVEKILLGAGQSVLEEAYCDINEHPREPVVRCQGGGVHGIVYELRMHVDKAKLGDLRSDLYKKIMRELVDKNLIANSLQRDVTINIAEESAAVKILTVKKSEAQGF